MRPAWAHTCGCESRCELVTVSKAKRSCARVTERGEEAWSVNREPMNKKRIEGVTKQVAKRVAQIARCWWRCCAGAFNRVMIIAYFDKLGVPRLS